MYKKILVALENGPADKTMLPQIAKLAARLGSELLLLHVADGWVARHYDELALRESEEMKADRAYLEKIQADLISRGFPTQTHLAMGDPATELVRVAAAEHPDLIAMSTHGHRFLNDIIRGSTADRVRHNVAIPVLMIKAR